MYTDKQAKEALEELVSVQYAELRKQQEIDATYYDNTFKPF